MFFTRQAFSISIPLITPWDPILDPCGKRVILTSIREIQIQNHVCFLPIEHFPFSFLWLFFGVPFWILVAKV